MLATIRYTNSRTFLYFTVPSRPLLAVNKDLIRERKKELRGQGQRLSRQQHNDQHVSNLATIVLGSVAMFYGKGVQFLCGEQRGLKGRQKGWEVVG